VDRARGCRDPRLDSAILRSGAALLIGLAVLGVCGAIAALRAREGDDALLAAQARGVTVTDRSVAAAVSLAREPVAGGSGSSAQRADCLREGRDPSRWFCLVEYRSGAFVEYAVKIQPSGAFTGVDSEGRRRISGCCVRPRS
jgi:hypothetical protein